VAFVKIKVKIKNLKTHTSHTMSFQGELSLKDFCEAILFAMGESRTQSYFLTYNQITYPSSKLTMEDTIKSLNIKPKEEMRLESKDICSFQIQIEEIIKVLQEDPVLLLEENEDLQKVFPKKEKPIIGIVGRIEETLDQSIGTLIPDSYLRAITEQGGSAIGIITSKDYASIDRRIIKQCDGIFLIGGKVAKDYHFEILNTAIEEKIPVLGICLGMQIIGMNSIQERVIAPIEHHETTIVQYEDNYTPKHKVFLKKGTRIYDIFGQEEMIVNSRHSKQILSIASPYIVSAVSETGSIEAIELKDENLFVVGVQWHPETYPQQEKLFQEFLKAAQKSLSQKTKN